MKNCAFSVVSNGLYDREKAADDYNYYLDENCYAEEPGFDLVELNVPPSSKTDPGVR